MYYLEKEEKKRNFVVSEFLKTRDEHITGLVGDKMAFLGIWTVCLRVAESTALSKIKQLLKK